MKQGQQMGIRPPWFLRVGARATHTMKVVTDGAALSPARRSVYRKWRSDRDKPSPVERVQAMIVELHTCGVSIATLRTIPRTFDTLLDDLSTGAAMPVLTLECLRVEAALEHTENDLSLRVASGDRSTATLHAYADALEAEAHHQLELARAARHEARTQHLRKGGR